MDELNETQEVTEEQGAPAESGGTPEPDTFDRQYVEKLRRESAGYRDKLRSYEEQYSVFDGYDDEERAVWKDLASTWKQDPRAAAEAMNQIAQSVLEQKMAEAAEAEEPLTRGEFQRMQAEAKAEAQRQADVGRVEHEARELGYDLSSRAYRVLLLTASELPSGDLAEAHAMLEADRQRDRDEYKAQLMRDAEQSPMPPAGNGSSPSGERQLKSWADAEAAMEARLNNAFRNK